MDLCGTCIFPWTIAAWAYSYWRDSHICLRISMKSGITMVGLNYLRSIPYSWGWGLVSPEIWQWEMARGSVRMVCLCMCVCVLVAPLCPTPCDSVDCSLPGSSVCGILQARISEWVTIPFARVSSQSRNWTWVSWTAGSFFTIWAIREGQNKKCMGIGK